MIYLFEIFEKLTTPFAISLYEKESLLIFAAIMLIFFIGPISFVLIIKLGKAIREEKPIGIKPPSKLKTICFAFLLLFDTWVMGYICIYPIIHKILIN